MDSASDYSGDSDGDPTVARKSFGYCRTFDTYRYVSSSAAAAAAAAASKGRRPGGKEASRDHQTTKSRGDARSSALSSSVLPSLEILDNRSYHHPGRVVDTFSFLPNSASAYSYTVSRGDSASDLMELLGSASGGANNLYQSCNSKSSSGVDNHQQLSMAAELAMMSGGPRPSADTRTSDTMTFASSGSAVRRHLGPGGPATGDFADGRDSGFPSGEVVFGSEGHQPVHHQAGSTIGTLMLSSSLAKPAVVSSGGDVQGGFVVQTVGKLRQPNMSRGNSRMSGSVRDDDDDGPVLALSMPLGSVPGQGHRHHDDDARFGYAGSEAGYPDSGRPVPAVYDHLTGVKKVRHDDSCLETDQIGDLKAPAGLKEEMMDEFVGFRDRLEGDGMSSDDFDFDEVVPGGLEGGDKAHLDHGVGPSFALGGLLTQEGPSRYSELEYTLQNLSLMDVEQRRLRTFGGSVSSLLAAEDLLLSDRKNAGDLQQQQHRHSRNHFLPYGVRTPDSIFSGMSADEAAAGGYCFGGFKAPGGQQQPTTNFGWRLSDKLRIVKPLEGSLTLHNWQQLATPSLGGLFEKRSGVAVRGELMLDYDLTGRGGGNGNEMVDGMPSSSDPDGSTKVKTKDKVKDVRISGSFWTERAGCEDEEDDDGEAYLIRNDTRPQVTLTNSLVLHPESGWTGVTTSAAAARLDSVTVPTNVYPRSHMSSGFGVSRVSSVGGSLAGSRFASLNDLSRHVGGAEHLTLTHLYNNSSNYRRDSWASIASSRDEVHSSMWRCPSSDSDSELSRSVSKIDSLTPSVIHSPKALGSYSPTGTPVNTPERRFLSPTGERKAREDTPSPSSDVDAVPGPGLVESFFSYLKKAIYSEQVKEATQAAAKTQAVAARKHHLQRKKLKRLGIMQKVEEVGLENLFSSSASSQSSSSDAESVVIFPDKARKSPYYLSGSQTHSDLKALSFQAVPFDDEGAHDPADELLLLDIVPGSLTIGLNGLLHPERRQGQLNPGDPTIGQLRAPALPHVRPSLRPGDLGRVPPPRSPSLGSAGFALSGSGSYPAMGGRGPGRVISPGQKRPVLEDGDNLFGVPGQPGTGALTRVLSVRPDLGTVPSMTVSSSVGSGTFQGRGAPPPPPEEQPSFIGTLASMFFGRKGGLL